MYPGCETMLAVFPPRITTGAARGGDAKRGSGRPWLPIPSTTFLPRIASASCWSLEGSACSARARLVGRIGISAAIIAGENRSGSEKRRSRPIDAGSASEMRVMSSARRVRGHGHCP